MTTAGGRILLPVGGFALLALLSLVPTGGCSRWGGADDGPPIAAWAASEPREKLTNLYCGKCHKPAEEAWLKSHHSKANRMVSRIADAPMFAGQAGATYGSDYEFNTDWKSSPVIRETRLDGSVHEFRPSMVIARTPLWQYMIETEPGRFQVTEVAWDPDKKEWFGVYGMEERHHGEWGHWTGRGMNWNSMCARCHMTAYSKNYDAVTDRYSSGWSEQAIGCIQCHHTMPGHEPGGEAMAGIDNFARDPHRMMHTCVSCHSRASSLTPAFVPGEVYEDHFRLQLPVEPALYYPDGQILDEVFVFASFRHSKMHTAGVTCMDCHDSHTGAIKLPQENNQICMQCHSDPGRNNAPVIDPTAHSFHKPESTGNRCVECHMVETTYMQRDPRRDHGFIIPDPVLTRDLGVPNACSRCHHEGEQTLEWNIGHYEKWYGAKMAESRHRPRARAVAGAFQSKAESVPELLALIGTEKVSAWRASLLTLADRLAPGSPPVVEAARAMREDPDPLVRSATVRALASDPASRPLVAAALEDPVRLVRIDAAWALSPTLAADSPQRLELDVQLRESLDHPTGRLQMAQDLFNRGRRAEAVAMVQSALEWDPLTPVLPETLGFMLSAQGRPVDAAQALERAVELAPDNAGTALYAALAWSEAGDFQRAETMLGVALRTDPTLARGWYNLGLLQVRTNRVEQAVVSLREAARLSPQEPDFPYALATVYLQLGRTDDALAAARRVLAIDPDYNPATQLIQQVEGRRSAAP